MHLDSFLEIPPCEGYSVCMFHRTIEGVVVPDGMCLVGNVLSTIG